MSGITNATKLSHWTADFSSGNKIEANVNFKFLSTKTSASQCLLRTLSVLIIPTHWIDVNLSEI